MLPRKRRFFFFYNIYIYAFRLFVILRYKLKTFNERIVKVESKGQVKIKYVTFLLSPEFQIFFFFFSIFLLLSIINDSTK